MTSKRATHFDRDHSFKFYTTEFIQKVSDKGVRKRAKVQVDIGHMFVDVNVD